MATDLLQAPGHGAGPEGPGAASRDAAGSAFLIVLCHGFGGDSSQLLPLADAWRDAFPLASFLLPDAPHPCGSRLWRAPGRQWFSRTQSRAVQMRAAAEAARWLNLRVDEALAERGLKPGAVVYCGFSQGGMVVLLAGLLRSVAPLGIVSMAGALLAPEAGFAVQCRPPVLLVHGAADDVVPAARSEDAAVRLGAMGVPVRLEILPSLGHIVVTEAAPVAAAFIAGVTA